jgi:hypothetical protein
MKYMTLSRIPDSVPDNGKLEASIFRSPNRASHWNFLAHTKAETNQKAFLSPSAAYLAQKLTEILAAYRKYCSLHN